jgi:DNA-binding MarR family transcriptional regulator
MAAEHYSVDTFTPADSIGYLIKRCGLLMSGKAETAFETQPVSFTQWIALMKLRERGAHMSATELSCEMGHDMGALTRMVDSLEKLGYVRRERSTRDRRAVEIELTPQGLAQVEDSMHLMVGLINALLEPFSQAEVKTLIGQLQRMLQRLQDYEPDVGTLAAKAEQAAKARKARAPAARKSGGRA